MRPLVLALLPILASGCIVIDDFECRHREQRDAVVPAPAGLAIVEVHALAGSLAIHGDGGSGEVRVKGIACARHQRDLGGIQVTTRVEGDRVVVEAVVPQAASRRGARLDLTLEVPAGARLRVEDASGDTRIDRVAAVDVDDGSGDLLVDHVTGEVSIHDQSGDVVVDGAGAVRIDDDSGDLLMRNVAAVTVVDDGSGDISISTVAGDVNILDDGSGDIEVMSVGGGLTVEHDGSGDIDYTAVAGAVDVPGHRVDRSLPAEAPES